MHLTQSFYEKVKFWFDMIILMGRDMEAVSENV